MAGLAAVTLVVTMLRAHTGEESDGAARIAHVLLGVGWILFVWTMITDLVLRLPLLVAGIENPVRSRLVAVVLAVVVLGLALWGSPRRDGSHGCGGWTSRSAVCRPKPTG